MKVVVLLCNSKAVVHWAVLKGVEVYVYEEQGVERIC